MLTLLRNYKISRFVNFACHLLLQIGHKILGKLGLLAQPSAVLEGWLTMSANLCLVFQGQSGIRSEQTGLFMFACSHVTPCAYVHSSCMDLGVS